MAGKQFATVVAQAVRTRAAAPRTAQRMASRLGLEMAQAGPVGQSVGSAVGLPADVLDDKALKASGQPSRLLMQMLELRVLYPVLAEELTDQELGV